MQDTRNKQGSKFMKIAYFGSDLFISCMKMLIQSGNEIISVFTVDNIFSRKIKEYALEQEIPVNLQKPTIEDIRILQEMGCEMILSAGYDHKIPKWEGGNIRYGVNVHPSLLPEGAGPSPLPSVITKELEEIKDLNK